MRNNLSILLLLFLYSCKLDYKNEILLKNSMRMAHCIPIVNSDSLKNFRVIGNICKWEENFEGMEMFRKVYFRKKKPIAEEIILFADTLKNEKCFINLDFELNTKFVSYSDIKSDRSYSINEEDGKLYYNGSENELILRNTKIKRILVDALNCKQ